MPGFATCSRINRTVRSGCAFLRCRKRRPDIRTRAGAAIDQAHFIKRCKCTLIRRAPPRLEHRRVIPIEFQPAQILFDRGDEIWANARCIQVLEAQQKSAFGVPRCLPCDPCRIGMAMVQKSCRTGGETFDDHRWSSAFAVRRVNGFGENVALHNKIT